MDEKETKIFVVWLVPLLFQKKKTPLKHVYAHIVAKNFLGVLSSPTKNIVVRNAPQVPPANELQARAGQNCETVPTVVKNSFAPLAPLQKNTVVRGVHHAEPNLTRNRGQSKGTAHIAEKSLFALLALPIKNIAAPNA